MRGAFRASIVVGAAIGCHLLAAGGAEAQWIYEGQESAFGGSGTHMVLTAHAGYALAIRCDTDGPVLVYLTPETFENADALNVAEDSQLLVRIDDGSVERLSAKIDSAERKLRFTSDADASMLKAIQDAKARVAIAVALADKTFHEQSFPARGSTKAMQKFMTGCKTIPAG